MVGIITVQLDSDYSQTGGECLIESGPLFPFMMRLVRSFAVSTLVPLWLTEHSSNVERLYSSSNHV
jgi:hypothetical protein